MKSITIEYDWLERLLPEGFPYPSSTLLSGAGGTGKPLVEFAFVASWLRSGGSVIAIPLQYPSMGFVDMAMARLYNVNLQEHEERVSYIKFELHIDKHETVGKNTLKANLLKPEAWDEAIKIADDMIKKSDLGTMVFGSALNLLLFSPTYRDRVFNKILDIIENEKSKTYIFSVSTSVYADEIGVWEDAADNVMYTRMEQPMRLFFRVTKTKGVSFLEEEIQVPISQDILAAIKEIAEATRKRIIPQIMEI
jgi:archaellum biogenesis ATPase FlaH